MKATLALVACALGCSSGRSGAEEATTILDVTEPTELNASFVRGAPLDDEARIVKQVKSRLPAVNYCYAKQRRIEPRLSGKMTVKITVAPAPGGSVVSAEVTERSLQSPAVETCVLSTVRSFAFHRKGKEPLSLNLPFIFR